MNETIVSNEGGQRRVESTADSLVGRRESPSYWQRVWGLLTRQERRRGLRAAALVMAAGAFEFIGVGSIFPFLNVLTNPARVEEDAYLAWSYHTFGFESTKSFLIALGIATLAMIILANAVSLWSVWVQTKYIGYLRHGVAFRLFQQYLLQPYPYFLRRNSAELNKNVLVEIGAVIAGVVRPAIVLVGRFTALLAVFILLLLVEPVVTLILVALIGGCYGPTYLWMRNRLERMGGESREFNRLRHKAVQEAFQGIKEIKVSGTEGSALQSYDGPMQGAEDRSVRSGLFKETPKYVIQAVLFSGMMGVFIFLIADGASLRRIIPVAGLFAFAGYRILPAFQEVLTSLTQFRFNKSSLEVLHDDLNAGATLAPAPEPLPFRSEVRLRGASFAYEGADRNAVTNLEIVIPKNGNVALVGTTGAGKTTTLDLLLGLLEPTSGDLVVDGKDVRGEDLRRWRANVGYVPQNITLRDDSIARNIAYGVPDDRIDMVAVERAARIAHIHEFVQGLPNGYETEVGEQGTRLSGGERQRIGIARALYRDPEVLVLDEATSDIDNVTQANITAALRELNGRKTVIVVAHRLSTIRECDTIYLLEGGRVVARGTYDGLLEDSPAFRGMARELQAVAGS